MSTLPSEPIATAATAAPERPAYHVLLGKLDRWSPQWGVLGTDLEVQQTKIIAIDLQTIHTICLFGEPGVGKSFAMGVIVEMALTTIKNVNRLPKPMAGVVFHYTPSPVYKPELAASFYPNNNPANLKTLLDVYKSGPSTIDEILIVTPRGMVDSRRLEFGAKTGFSADPQAPWQGVRVESIAFSGDKLTALHWKILMGAVGENDSLYLQVVNQILRQRRDASLPMSVASLREGIESSTLTKEDKDRADIRLRLAGEYVGNDAVSLGSWLKRGRLVIIDLRDEFIEKREALSLGIVMLQLCADTMDVDGKPLQKFFVLDEAHKYMKDPYLVEHLTEIIREMRHKATTVMIASQDPPSIPDTIIELSSLTVILKMSSPQWVSHVKRVKDAYASISTAQFSSLRPGEAYVWSKFSSDPAYSTKATKMSIRPRATKHGGETKEAII